MSPLIQDTPPALVERGRIQRGFFKTPFQRVNLLDADNFGGALARPLRWLRLKEWVGFGFDTPEVYGAMIIQNAKIAASGAVYLFEKKPRRFHEWLVLDLPTRAALPETLWRGESRCSGWNGKMNFTHDLDHCRHDVQVRIKESGKAPALSAELTLRQDWRKTDPLVVSLPIAPEHHTYTHKSPLRLEGTLRVGASVFTFDPANCLGNLDEQKTFYPYRSHWKWGCFAAITQEGREVAVNFVNQMTPREEPGEDAMWIDGKLSLIDRPQFIPLALPGAFNVEDRAGRLNLRFSPMGSKAEKRNYGLIRMDYEQFFGPYDGEVVDETGGVHRIRGAYGALECMEARF